MGQDNQRDLGGKSTGDTGVCLRPHTNGGTQTQMWLPDYKNLLSFPWTILRWKGSNLRPFQGKKELVHCACRSFQKYPALQDRSAYDMLYLNEVKPLLSQERVDIAI